MTNLYSQTTYTPQRVLQLSWVSGGWCNDCRSATIKQYQIGETEWPSV